MRIPRIYYTHDLHTNALVQLSAETSHYILQVLRLKLNAPLRLFNGKKGEYNSTLIAIEKKQALIAVGEFLPNDLESPLHLHLGQGISRSEKMDFTIQKAVELGVAKVTPLLTAYCAVKLSEERQHKRFTHWKKIMISACEQCGRNQLPELMPITTVTDWLSRCQETVRWICAPGGKSPFCNIQPSDQVALLIGPEGGLSEDEIQCALRYRFQTIRLGPRILRTETAALAAITLLQSHWGDMR
jgi:16S rRNA (uracil1498-N3)-methyltransferase